MICIVVSMVSGTLWDNPKTFFPARWPAVGAGIATGHGNHGHDLNAYNALSSIVQAVSMAFMVRFMGSATAVSGAVSGFMLWLDFIAPTYHVNKLFAGHGLRIWAIDMGTHPLDFQVFSVILVVWQ